MRSKAIVVATLVGLVAGLVGMVTTPASAATTIWVSPAMPTFPPLGSSCAKPAFNSIQDAVNSASPGNKIKVCAGTYAEQVRIDKSLTLAGASSASTVITYPAAPLPGDVCDVGPAGLNSEPIMQICGPFAPATVKMSGFTIQGPYPINPGCADQPQGIFVGDGSTLNLSGTHVTGIKQSDPGLYGCQGGVGILVGRFSTGQFGKATIKNVVVSDYQKAGIVADNLGSSVSVSSTTVTGPGSPSALAAAIAMNGIQISRLATGKISDVTVSGNNCDVAVCGPDPVTDTQSAGILLFDPGKTSVKGSIIRDNDMGIYNFENPPSPSISITSNNLTDNRYEGIQFDAGKATASSNRVSGGNIGVSMIIYAGQSQNPVGTFTSGVVTGTSVAAIEVDTDGSLATTPNLAATLNDLSGNSAAGVLNNTDTPVNVTRNWWGDVSGPSDWSIGIGATVSANADFFPWALNSTVTLFRACDVGPLSFINDDNTASTVQVLCGTGGGDFIQETGPNAVLILGNGGNDQLFGGGGDDSVIGGSASDFIQGFAGSDHGQGRGGLDTCSADVEFTNNC